MPKKTRRSIEDVSDDELKAAVIKMCAELGIPGSGSVYSIFTAVYKEKQKVIDLKKASGEIFGDE